MTPLPAFYTDKAYAVSETNIHVASRRERFVLNISGYMLYSMNEYVVQKFIAINLDEIMNERIDNPSVRMSIIIETLGVLFKKPANAILVHDIVMPPGGATHPYPPQPDKTFEEFAKQLPGVHKVANYPCDCLRIGKQGKLIHIIIHLNDNHKWTRDRIADWLETLDIDLEFK